MDNIKEFFRSLFDYSFKEFLIVKVVKVLYIFAIIAAFVYNLWMFLASIQFGFGRALFMFVASIIWFFVMVLLARAFLELIIVLFRIAENTDKIAGSAVVKSPFKTEMTAPVEVPTIVRKEEPAPEPEPETQTEEEPKTIDS